jgi:uncharacterized RDD family membrane protein YckC
MTYPPPPSGDPNQPPPNPYPQSGPGGFGGQPGYPPPGGGYPPPGGGYGAYPSAPPPSGGYAVTGGLALPPGVELASVGRRIGAFFLAIPLTIVTLVIGYLIWGLVLWGRGTSPALKVLGMKVIKVDTGRPATFGTMALRDIIGRICDGVLSIITELISFIMFVTGDRRQSLHDKVGGTTVVYDPKNILG